MYDVYWGIIGTVPPPTTPPPIAPPTTTEIPPYPGTAIKNGDKGLNVLLVQQAINRLADYISTIPKIVADGSFGSGTENAVKAVQLYFGLAIDGKVGSQTWQMLMQEYFNNFPPGAPTPPKYPNAVIGRGDIGINVLFIQQAINRLADFNSNLYKITADGSFGPGTEAAVKVFQGLYGLGADGRVGPATWNKLMDEYIKTLPTPPPPSIPPWPGYTLQMDSTGPNVLLIQKAINTLADNPTGMYRVTEDGHFGAETRDALYTFQKKIGLTIDGKAGQATWDRLMLEASKYTKLHELNSLTNPITNNSSTEGNPLAQLMIVVLANKMIPGGFMF